MRVIMISFNHLINDCLPDDGDDESRVYINYLVRLINLQLFIKSIHQESQIPLLFNQIRNISSNE